MSADAARRDCLAARLFSKQARRLERGMGGSRWMCLPAAALGLFAAVPTSLMAQETTTFSYDAKGRVTKSTRTSGPSGGVVTTYDYDRADNRTKVSVTGSPNGNGNNSSDGSVSVQTTRYIVVPLNGFTLIPIG